MRGHHRLRLVVRVRWALVVLGGGGGLGGEDGLVEGAVGHPRVAVPTVAGSGSGGVRRRFSRGEVGAIARGEGVGAKVARGLPRGLRGDARGARCRDLGQGRSRHPEARGRPPRVSAPGGGSRQARASRRRIPHVPAIGSLAGVRSSRRRAPASARRSQPAHCAPSTGATKKRHVFEVGRTLKAFAGPKCVPVLVSQNHPTIFGTRAPHDSLTIDYETGVLFPICHTLIPTEAGRE